MSDVEKIVKKVHIIEDDYGCNEYSEVSGLDNRYAPYYVMWMIVEGVKYYFVEISVDVDPGNDHPGWLPAVFVPDVGDRLIISSDRAVEFSFFDKWGREEGLVIAYNDVINGYQKVAETRKLVFR